MKEIKLRHLQKRLGIYRFRRKISLDLQSHYDGKAELSFSLETKDRKAAEPLVRKWGVFYDSEFEKLRSNLQDGQSSTSPAGNLATPTPSRPNLAEGLSIEDVNVLAARLNLSIIQFKHHF